MGMESIGCLNLDLKLEVDSIKKLEERLKNPPNQCGQGIACSSFDLKLEVDNAKKLEEELKNPPNQRGHGIGCSSFDLKLESSTKKLRLAYEKGDNAKKRKYIQVIDFQPVPNQEKKLPRGCGASSKRLPKKPQPQPW
ncbi:hypothetical protein FH972_001756 [Carpinus fangiana]|uniref:Uncharacterized protein n=1 Tax=Carpinus fangiana TaxID=176857 RepID=A0A5N6QEJ6_9ROSI|nr:hypothetical protein FH972_001756 [Carpinus fangiana]